MTSKSKPAKLEDDSNTDETSVSAAPAAMDSAELVAKAVADGKAALADGKTKIDAAMVIFRLIHDQPQQAILKAFVDGATLTEKGALTYWYNCRRKLAREQRG